MARKRNSKNKKNRRKASKDKSNLSQSTTSLSSTDSAHSSSILEQQHDSPLENNGNMMNFNLIRNVDDQQPQQQTNSLLNNVAISSSSNSIPILSSGNADTSLYTRRSAVTSRWVDEQDFSPASSPINNVIVVDERHEVKLEILEKSHSSHHHHMSSSLIDAQFDEQFEKATSSRKTSKKKLTVASWSASSVEGENIDEDDDNNKSTIQQIGEQAPDLILLQDVNYGQLIKSLKCLKKAEEHLEMKHEETMTDSEDNEPPVYKWFCCGHKNSYEPSKLDETIESSEERDEDTPMIQSTSTTSIITRFLQNEVRNRETEDRDPDDFVTEYLPIIYNSERLKCVDCGVYWFSKNHKEAGTKSWDSLVPRFCNWAAFVFKPYDEEAEEEYKDFIVFNTHWDQGVEARRYAAHSMRQEIVGKMSNYNSITNKTTITPTITVGNFNSLPKSNALSILVTGTDLGAHNNDDQTKPIDSDSDSDDFPTPYDRESLIIPCQKQLSASLMVFEKTDSRQSTASSEDHHDEDNDEDESSESESYSGTWYHNVAFEPTFVDQETKESSTLDYVFISPCVKTLDFQLLETNTSTESQHHKPLITTFEL
ncbi:hypothetical protein NAEGRDRAFT_57389 [Naegleria gruberi]|uniref:Endonuclease/exonuclease/phosphatase domain-containing protein n=1 Tax=Naegleria gruberi TaxID=5762 RepID=D2V7J2_NAEGR|nr:uncharacterized protein NAEGRDRAFT_57389 [Naegleria gruberi]EFC47388.1 hypothetical protein NAEGRDRAFT_57389 [Naegleria gruberi]|eukprot:XP_002680132.1 hypothetical protein NAEGRDRAFT_57389 [Naegleria gruberi strain NEG-M]